MNKRKSTIIFQRASGKLPVFRQTETAPRFCLTADSVGINLPAGRPKRAPSKVSRNPALCDAAIPNWPTNPGLCPSRAVAVWWPKYPATSPSSCAISAPASRLNSLGSLSPPPTVGQAERKSVFTHTQTTQKCYIFPLAIWIAKR